MKLYVLQMDSTINYYTDLGEWKHGKENAKTMTWDEAEQLMYKLYRENGIRSTVTYK